MSKRKQNSKSPQKSNVAEGTHVRLQKLLAAHGHGSRRGCEEFILDGRVTVDGKVVKKLGTKVDPENQKVALDGERLIAQKLQYFMLNKPPGIVSTARDPAGRLRVIDLIKTNTRVYNVGRLDKSSEGLILVTNDGDLANRLTHPRYGVEKKYHVLVKGRPGPDKLASLKKGIYLAEARVQVANVRIKKRVRDGTWLEIILDEGRNREIRRILARIGHKVVQLRRVAIGPLQLGDLPIGMHRKLTIAEIKRLKKSTKANSLPGRKKAGKKTARKKSKVARNKVHRAGKTSNRKKSHSTATGRKTSRSKTSAKLGYRRKKSESR